MKNLEFTWNAGLDNFDSSDDESLVISGILVDASVCANNFAIDEAELPKIAEQLKNATLRVDHSKSARDVIGGFKSGTYDAKNKRVLFEAEVDDPVIKRSIIKGRLKYISIGASADAFCSKCDKPTKPIKMCKCKDSHDVIRNTKLKEGSIITEPAYQTSEFHPVSFVASIESALTAFDTAAADSSKEEGVAGQVKNLEEKKEMPDKEEKVEATTLKPAGKDAVVLLGEQLEAISTKLESLIKKKEDEERKKKDEDEAKKKKDEDETKKKESDQFTKFEQSIAGLSTKLDEALKVKVKKEPPTEEEDEEKKKCKKEEVATTAPIKGAKVEKPDASTDVTATEEVPWWGEIKAAAQKLGIMD